MHSCAPAVLLYVGVTACVELFCCLVCFLSATTQRPHHGWILGVETKPHGQKSAMMKVSFYTTSFASYLALQRSASGISRWCVRSQTMCSSLLQSGDIVTHLLWNLQIDFLANKKITNNDLINNKMFDKLQITVVLSTVQNTEKLHHQVARFKVAHIAQDCLKAVLSCYCTFWN